VGVNFGGGCIGAGLRAGAVGVAASGFVPVASHHPGGIAFPREFRRAASTSVVLRRRAAIYLRSTNIARQSAEPVFSAVWEAVIGTALEVPALGVMFVVFPSAAVSFNVQSLTL
jgi:hypothetical protein